MSATNWAAVGALAEVAAAIGTFAYLVISLLLWSTTKKVADAGIEQVVQRRKLPNAALQQTTQTADAVAVARQQAGLAEAQFALSRQMFALENQPLLVFDAPPQFDFSAPASPAFRAEFTIRNQGRVTATRVRWRINLEVGGNHYKTFPPVESTELAPNQITGSSVDGIVPGTAWLHPACLGDNQQVSHSMCELRRDPQVGQSIFRSIHRTPHQQHSDELLPRRAISIMR